MNLLNEVFDWDHASLEDVDAVSGPSEKITAGEARSAISNMKTGKAAGPLGVTVEMIVASDMEGVL